VSAVVNSDLARFIEGHHPRSVFEAALGTRDAPKGWHRRPGRDLALRRHAAAAHARLRADHGEAAERRLLMLENPALAGTTFITPALFAGLQAILPGRSRPTTAIRRTRCASSSKARRLHRGRRRAPSRSSGRLRRHRRLGVARPRQRGPGAGGGGWTAWTRAFANLFGAHFREDYPEEKQRAARPQERELPVIPL